MVGKKAKTKKQLEQKVVDLNNNIKILQKKADALKKLEDVEKDKGIVIYRQYFTYSLINSRVMEVKAFFHLFVPGGSDVWVYKLPGYLASLDVTTGDNKSLPILSDHELNLLFTNEKAKFVTQDSLKKIFEEQMTVNEPIRLSSDENQKSHFVGFIIPQYDEDHFQKIIIKWTEQIRKEDTSKDTISQYVNRLHTVESTTSASVYLNITMDRKKYEIQGKPQITAIDKEGKNAEIKDGDQYKKILQDKTNYVYRIKRNCPLKFTLKWSIGIPAMIRRWAWAGFLIAILVLSFSVITFIIDPSASYENSKLLAGLIAMLVGFRVLLFHDIELMYRWNVIYLGFLGSSVILILIMQGISYAK